MPGLAVVAQVLLLVASLTVTPGRPALAQSPAGPGTSGSADEPVTNDPMVTKWVRRFLRLPPEQRGVWAKLYAGYPPEQAHNAPPALRLAAADYYLRSGRPRVANRIFADVFETTQGTEMAPF